MRTAKSALVPWMASLAMGLSLCLGTGSSQAESAHTRLSGSPKVVPAEQHGQSPRLRDVPETIPEMPAIKEISRHPRPARPGRKGVVDPVLQGPVAGPAMPGPARSFEGVGNVDSVLPPDTNGAVGPEHYVQWVNISFGIFDKATGALVYGPTAGNTLWQTLGGPCATENDGDPVVLYDHLAGRWFFSQLALPGGLSGPFYQCIAVSQTGDPTGAFNLYAFKISDTKLNDYPKFGVWPDAYYMAINQFHCSSGCAWAGQGVVAFERAKMLDGLPANMVYFDLASVDSTLGGMLPADLNGPAPPPGTPNYFAQFDDDAWGYSPDQLQVWAFHVDWATPASSSFTKEATLATAPFDSDLCGYARGCIPQPGTSRKVDALSDRLMYRLQYRNFGGYATLVTNHSVDVDGGNHAGIRWYELRDSGSGWSIQQQGTFAPDADHRFMGSIAMDTSGNIALGYSVSGSSTFPSIRYSGRLATDPPGTLPQGETTLVNGSGSQTGTESRWGDYSLMAVDPTDDCTFWYTQEYYAATSARGWQTRFGAFKFPSCGAQGSADLSLTGSVSPDPVLVGGDVTYTLSVTNHGPDVATSVILSDSLPGGVTLASVSPSQGSCSTGSSVTCALGSLDPGGSAMVSIVATPSAGGPISNVASVSSLLPDPSPANNSVTLASAVKIIAPDLVETAVSRSPAVGTPGSKLSVTDTVENRGTTAAGASKVRFYLSLDTAGMIGRKLLTGARSVPELASGSTSTGTVTVTIPSNTPLGTYYLLACADDTALVTESDETNNCLASAGTVEVTRPDLVEMAVSDPPASVRPGNTFSVTDTVANQGLTGAGASKVRFYLSGDTKKGNDRLLSGVRSVSSLAAGAASTGNTTVTVPLSMTSGTYYLLACADDTRVVVETDDTNNCLAAATRITVQP